MIWIKTIVVFILAFLAGSLAWSALLFGIATSLGASMQEAGQVEIRIAPWLALATAFVVVRYALVRRSR